MKAGVLHKLGDISYENVEKPKIKNTDVLIKVKFAGICGGDFARVWKTGCYSYPIILGHEISGIVSEVGEKVKRVKTGDRVTVDPFIPCYSCSYCKEGKPQLCSNYSYVGSRCDGGFAEYVSVPDFSVIKLPNSINLQDACQIEPLVMMLRVIPENINSIAIMGVGVAGSYLIKWSKLLGIKKIIAISRSAWKLELAIKLGATYLYNSVCVMTDEIPEVDVVIDASSSSVIEKDISLVKKQGTIILIGTPNCDVLLKRKTYDRILRKEITIKGVWCSYFSSSYWDIVIGWLSSKEIKIEPVVTHIFKLKDIEKAFKVKKHNKILLEV